MGRAFEQSTFVKGELQMLGHCPVCKARFSGKHASVIRRTEEFSLFHVDCTRCKSSSLIQLRPGPLQLVTSMIMLTDLNKEDIPRLAQAEMLSSDDVLALHAHFRYTQTKS